MTTSNLVRKSGSWEVLDIESLSDHQYVLYNLKFPERKTQAVRNGWAWRKLDSFIATARALSTDNAETSFIECTELLKEACNNCKPNGQYKCGEKPCY